MPETHTSHLVNPVNGQFLKILLKSQPYQLSDVSFQFTVYCSLFTDQISPLPHFPPQRARSGLPTSPLPQQ
ncbi:unknown protein [Microcystis aeruginosa NIES-843]|uniref:Uncharacterized protein n=1 Tax=Microcystis aeruginosa (strain NIES-843 / IAM M-2473) TaxID=449447 RepID=B0JJI0_MICAN|nr:unknown protein [Microcystis aeruginosa NIES-843]